MKLFPIRPLSNFDRFKNLCNIMKNYQNKFKNSHSNIVSYNINSKLKKGSDICDMLSE